jgi:lipid-A-disaccharide synthase
MKYYIIAGEASGDLHGSALIREIKKLDPNASFRCWGGDKMKEAGGELVKHYSDLAFMGFAEVLTNLRTIMGNLRFCKEDITQYHPDALILIDYPGFNLRIAKWARQQTFFNKDASKIIFYISPQVWAWKSGRVKQMKKDLDKMIVILPFEKEYFKEQWNWDVEYVGHPLLERIPARIEEGPASRSNTIALLPGSRRQEIAKKLPIMLEVSRAFPGYQFVVAKAPGVSADFYQPFLKGYENVSAVEGQTYEILKNARAALVTSGTATLETALIGVPEIVCYKGSTLSYEIGRRVVKVKYISLVNLILDKPAVRELIQHELTVENLSGELKNLLNDTVKINKLKEDYRQLREKLSTGGNASAKAAASIVQMFREKN